MHCIEFQEKAISTPGCSFTERTAIQPQKQKPWLRTNGRAKGLEGKKKGGNFVSP
jgi:hypothetical protein